MGRPRTGTLEMRNGTYHTRITVGVPPETRRDLYDLGTADEKLARQRLKHLLKTTAKAAANAEPAPSREQLKREIPKAETFGGFSERWTAKRKAQGIVSARDEENNLRRYVWPIADFNGVQMVDKPLVEGSIPSSMIERVLDCAIGAGLGQETLRKIRAVMNRVFKAALREEGTRLKTNPVTNTEVPKIKGVRKKQRAIPTDEELARYFACPKVDPELQMMVLAARVEGGMRTSDVIRWDWVDIDTRAFATCTIPRSKTDSPQALGIPPVLAETLRARWEAAGRPTTGPVFPVQRGPRKGQARAMRGVSFAARFRRDLRRAGVLRKELFVATERTLPVDFHSLRRAFVTRLAVAGINVQRAMALAGHTDQRTHMLYVGADPALQEIPAEVVPAVSFGSGATTPLLPSKNERATQDSNLRPSAPEAASPRQFAAQSNAGNAQPVKGLRRGDGARSRGRSGYTGPGVLAPDAKAFRAVHLLRRNQVALATEVAMWDALDATALDEP